MMITTKTLSVLDARPDEAMREFLALCLDARIPFDLASFHTNATRTIRYLHGDTREREHLRPWQELENRWYASLSRGLPDWSVYDDPAYLAELWACWMVYSRRYLRAIASANSLPPYGVARDLLPVRRVIDLGCGFGYTTAALKQMFPDAHVWGTNLSATVQMDVAQAVARVYGFAVVPTVDDIDTDSVDLVFASEYFEHIPEPIAHLREVVASVHPRAFLIANTFTQKAIGHFDSYLVDGESLDGKTTNRRFNEEMRALGYVKVRAKLWNNRPAYWRSDESDA